MYINRKDALEILGKLSREPYYQHNGEDYYVGVAEATGEIYSMSSVSMENILNEITEKIKMIDEYKQYEGEDAWFRAGICECIDRAVEIIAEYLSN